jgi:DNA adenine methylase
MHHDVHEAPAMPKARPVFSRPGGKTRMLAHILPLIPAHTCYCEPFFGGGAVFFGRPEKSAHEVINDIDSDLVKFLRNAKYHLDPLLDEMDLVLNARQEFRDFKEQRGLTEIQQAARWFIKNKLSFGGMGGTFAVGRTSGMSSRSQRLLNIRSMSQRLDKTTVENESWEKIFELYDAPATFFFLDPPYFDAGGQAYTGWSREQLETFCTAVKALQGSWMVTFQDCAEIRSLLAGFPIKAIERANGIGNNTGKTGRVYREVIITNAPAKAVRKGRK